MGFNLRIHNQGPRECEAVFSISDGELKPVTMRTNSLGVSKTPCYNCRASTDRATGNRPSAGLVRIANIEE